MTDYMTDPHRHDGRRDSRVAALFPRVAVVAAARHLPLVVAAAVIFYSGYLFKISSFGKFV
jgi:hypothetical protein